MNSNGPNGTKNENEQKKDTSSSVDQSLDSKGNVSHIVSESTDELKNLKKDVI